MMSFSVKESIYVDAAQDDVITCIADYLQEVQNIFRTDAKQLDAEDTERLLFELYASIGDAVETLNQRIVEKIVEAHCWEDEE